MELELWQIVVLAIVQGITEFLPISSDGHLVVVAALLAPGQGAESFELPDLVVVLHGGTLLSILLFYWRRIQELLWQDWHTARLIVVATIPAVLVGVPIKLFAEAWLGDPLLAGIFLIVTGLVLLTARHRPAVQRHYRELGYGTAFLLGMAQAAAILPGLSRSGCTISTGLRWGLTPVSAATFSFLMAIPAIGGACTLEALSILKAGHLSMPLGHLAVGTAVSFVVGLFALWWLVRWLESGRFVWFAAWCIPLGIAVIAWQLSR
ncbi:MAG: undecaprenyl-diphosphate phosphatase [Pirellulaceae bacterium]